MATTTPNFGWAVPTSTDLVKDGAVAIETLGDSIDASLVDLKGGTTGQVLAKASGTDMDFSWVAQDDSNAIQNAIVDAKGDIIAATANDTPARLAVGANNTVLTADSSTATGLKWAAAAGGGKLLQVVSARSTTSYTNSTTTMTDVTGLTATITPTSATSKILVIVSASVVTSCSSGTGYIGAVLQRNGSTISSYGGYGFIYANAPGILTQATIQHYDSPATTSATTYKMQAAIDSAINSMATTWQYTGSPSVITLLEIGA
jgi:hypothetical protein